MRKYIIAGIGVAVLGGIGTSMYFGAGESNVTFDPATAQVVVWNKPTTEKGWAEDVKKENFDIKSTGKLIEMRDVHVEKLKRVQEGKAEVFECPECIRFQVKKDHPEWSTADINTYYTDELAKANWEVEKLKQSIERMDNELRLRKNGFVVVAEEGVFGTNILENRLRHIND